jgi:hypothetical protein
MSLGTLLDIYDDKKAVESSQVVKVLIPTGYIGETCLNYDRGNPLKHNSITYNIFYRNQVCTVEYIHVIIAYLRRKCR